jgi:hypothetical protein
MYGVLYALSPELFPTKDRGTGNALVAIANRVFGIMVGILISSRDYIVETIYRHRLSLSTRTSLQVRQYSYQEHCSSRPVSSLFFFLTNLAEKRLCNSFVSEYSCVLQNKINSEIISTICYIHGVILYTLLHFSERRNTLTHNRSPTRTVGLAVRHVPEFYKCSDS